MAETPAHFTRSMVTFLIAFLAMCFHQPSAWRLVLDGGVSVLIVAAIAWCIGMAWEPHRQTAEADGHVQVDVPEEQGEKVEEGEKPEECDDEKNFGGPRKVSWRWSGVLFPRKRSDSDTTVVDV